VVLELQKRLGEAIRAALKEKYSLEVESIPLETPPDLRFGEIATPVALQLARTLRKAPKVIAQELVAALGTVDGFAGFEVAGAGYINARLDRAAAARDIAGELTAFAEKLTVAAPRGHVLVEHTSINPNKAAHIGHLRNAILGDTFVRLLRAANYKVDVQNYIDNTGVQVADVVLALNKIKHLEPASKIRDWIAETESSGRRVDYECWDLYAQISSEYENEGATNQGPLWKNLRAEYLHEIEAGNNDVADGAELISTAVLKRHLETMLRLGIEYDFLPRESEILHLKFWDAAFEQLKQTGVLRFEKEGKNAGCWVMTRPGSKAAEGEIDDDSKVIVRSKRIVVGDKITYDPNAQGTVTYVGKDIAYHLWKFGLLGRDFGYKRFFRYPDHECWISAVQGEASHPQFGNATAIYNVIDSRQSDPQANVIQALRGMGYTAQADHYTHFSYEMVALTPGYATDLGYVLSPEDYARPYIEISGRKGFGVKADDLMDLMIMAANSEILERHPDWEKGHRNELARKIAYGALRYFMLKYTRNSVIAFDQESALSPEGETGPYIQYAVVRIRNIFRKGGTTPELVLEEFAKSSQTNLAAYLTGDANEDIWSLWLRAGRFSLVLEQCISASEPAYLAKHAFQLAQDFANFYHNHHILTESDPARKTFLLATAAVALHELVRSLALLGIESPEAM
jgi:arginyl-tRNA synthetase